MPIVRKLLEKYDLIPTKPLGNMALSTVVRVISTYVVDMDSEQMKMLGEGLKDLGVELVSESVAKTAKGAVEGMQEE